MQIDQALQSITQFTDLVRNAPLAFQAEDWSLVCKEVRELKKSGVGNFEKYFEANPATLRAILDQAKPVYSTPATNNLFKTPDEEALFSLRAGTAYSRDMLSFVGKAIASFVNGVTSFEGETNILCFDGTVLAVHLKISLAQGHEENWSLVMLSSADNTEQKSQLKALELDRNRIEKASESKTAFLLDIGSEIMTPLNAIVNFADMMSQGVYGNLGAPQYEDYVRDIAQNAQQIVGLLEDMKDLALIEQSKLELQHSETSVDEAINWCVEIMRPKAIEDGVRVQVLHGEALPKLHADPRRVRQIVHNIVIHALEQGIKDSVIALKSKGNAQEGVTIETSFTIDEIEESYANFGLGMPLAKTLAELHKGKFWHKVDKGEADELIQTIFVWFPPDIVLG